MYYQIISTVAFEKEFLESLSGRAAYGRMITEDGYILHADLTEEEASYAKLKYGRVFLFDGDASKELVENGDVGLSVTKWIWP